MTPIELAFRHIARNDFGGRFFPRNVDELIQVCTRKHIHDEQEIAAAIAAYFDEIAQETAGRLGLCRVCRVRRPTHYHVEPLVKCGKLSEQWARCTKPYCVKPVRRVAEVCPACSATYRYFIHAKRETRRERLRRRGATVKPEVLR